MFVETLKNALQGYAQKKLSLGNDLEEIKVSVKERLAVENAEIEPKTLSYLKNLSAGLAEFDALTGKRHSREVIDACEDILAEHLDQILSTETADNEIFKDLVKVWEAEYMEDLKQLQVQLPNVTLTVSQMVPKIVAYIQEVIQSEFAYEAEGSVYFDVAASESNPEHRFANFCRKSTGKDLDKGEANPSNIMDGRRDPRDFALWKVSRPGEPFWTSPWGKGRPGWEICCSVIANWILHGKIDVHSCGLDVAFHQNDNENKDDWLSYFLQVGHVEVEDHNTNELVNGSISLKDALELYSSRQIRMFFLLHHWNSTAIFKKTTLKEASTIEKSFRTFMKTIEAIPRETNLSKEAITENRALQLLNDLFRAQEECDLALRDNIDTTRVIQSLRDLMKKANVYLSDFEISTQNSLRLVGEWIGKMLTFLGLGIEGATTLYENKQQMQIVLEKMEAFRSKIWQMSSADDYWKPIYYRSECNDIRKTLRKDHGIILPKLRDSEDDCPFEDLEDYENDESDDLEEDAECDEDDDNSCENDDADEHVDDNSGGDNENESDCSENDDGDDENESYCSENDGDEEETVRRPIRFLNIKRFARMKERIREEEEESKRRRRY